MSPRLESLNRPERYPLASTYDPAWVVSLDMGPHPLWQLEDLLPDLALEPGQKVLDLGCGKGATSVFLARECDVDVVAFDLWTGEDELRANLDAMGVADRVTVMRGSARDLPFDDDEFDAIVSVDAFEYFGTDVHLLPGLLRVLKPFGRLGDHHTSPARGPLPGPPSRMRHSPLRLGSSGLARSRLVGDPLAAQRPRRQRPRTHASRRG
jgi:ubiquinone/menaquinone biosynthesis C-methylase UbiE